MLDSGVASMAGYEGHGLYRPIRAWLDGLGDDPVFVSAISIGESEYGLNLNPLPAEVQQDIRSVMASYQVLPIDHHTARVYGRIRATLFDTYAPRDHRNQISARYVEQLRERTSGLELGIQENDLWIVSLAVQYNLVFATADSAGGMRNVVDAANYVHRTHFLT